MGYGASFDRTSAGKTLALGLFGEGDVLLSYATRENLRLHLMFNAYTELGLDGYSADSPIVFSHKNPQLSPHAEIKRRLRKNKTTDMTRVAGHPYTQTAIGDLVYECQRGNRVVIARLAANSPTTYFQPNNRLFPKNIFTGTLQLYQLQLTSERLLPGLDELLSLVKESWKDVVQ